MGEVRTIVAQRFADGDEDFTASHCTIIVALRKHAVQGIRHPQNPEIRPGETRRRGYKSSVEYGLELC